MRIFARNYVEFSIYEFLDAFFGSAIFSTAYIIALELVVAKHRTIVGILLNCFYALGNIYLGVVAMIFKNYKLVLLFCYIPAFLTITFIWLQPRSELKLCALKYGTSLIISFINYCQVFDGCSAKVNGRKRKEFSSKRQIWTTRDYQRQFYLNWMTKIFSLKVTRMRKLMKINGKFNQEKRLSYNFFWCHICGFQRYSSTMDSTSTAFISSSGINMSITLWVSSQDGIFLLPTTKINFLSQNVCVLSGRRRHRAACVFYHPRNDGKSGTKEDFVYWNAAEWTLLHFIGYHRWRVTDNALICFGQTFYYDCILVSIHLHHRGISN